MHALTLKPSSNRSCSLVIPSTFSTTNRVLHKHNLPISDEPRLNEALGIGRKRLHRCLHRNQTASPRASIFFHA